MKFNPSDYDSDFDPFVSETQPVKALCDVLPASKGENEGFSPPPPKCDVVPLNELPLRNNKRKVLVVILVSESKAL